MLHKSNSSLFQGKLDKLTPFFSGMGSLLNLSPSVEPFKHRINDFFIASDFLAIQKDFGIIGEEMHKALNQFKKEINV